MKRNLLILLAAMLLADTLSAQETEMPRLRHNSITTSPTTLLGDAFLLTYEHTLPHHSSLEVELGGQGFRWNEWRASISGPATRPGIVATIGYKLYLPRGEKNHAIANAGGLPPRSFFIKGRLSYVHQWSHYDVPRGNEGWDLITERYTLRENDLSLALILGKQFVSKHGFVAAPFFGFCIPLWIDGPFHDDSDPGNSAAFWGPTTWGVKLGWAF